MNLTKESVEAAQECEQPDLRTANETVDDTAVTALLPKPRRGPRKGWAQSLAFGFLPAVTLILVLVGGYAKWVQGSLTTSETFAAQSVQAAKDGSKAILTYNSQTVDADLNSARDRLVGEFLQSYTSLINDIVIPGSKEWGISAIAEVPAAGIISVDRNHSVVLVYVNQTTTIKGDPPTKSASSVRVSLDRVNGRWLISGFDPV